MLITDNAIRNMSTNIVLDNSEEDQPKPFLDVNMVTSVRTDDMRPMGNTTSNNSNSNTDRNVTAYAPIFFSDADGNEFSYISVTDCHLLSKLPASQRSITTGTRSTSPYGVGYLFVGMDIDRLMELIKSSVNGASAELKGKWNDLPVYTVNTPKANLVLSTAVKGDDGELEKISSSVQCTVPVPLGANALGAITMRSSISKRRDGSLNISFTMSEVFIYAAVSTEPSLRNRQTIAAGINIDDYKDNIARYDDLKKILGTTSAFRQRNSRSNNNNNNNSERPQPTTTLPPPGPANSRSSRRSEAGDGAFDHI
eukprot:GHVU01219723.1.p7 GENE.GHVU01219723.1~~GHVU01219723.1.p7  ORF type:complete len:311 (+),score=21.66 GHVU01219723.1:15675-16607(+)